MLFQILINNKTITFLPDVHNHIPKDMMQIINFLENMKDEIIILELPGKEIIDRKDSFLMNFIQTHYNYETFEPRNDFLTIQNSNDLYHNDTNHHFYFNTAEDIIDKFINPFFEKIFFFVISKDSFHESFFIFLTDFLTKIIKKFTELKILLQNETNKNFDYDNIIEELEDGWAMVFDFFIISFILNKHSLANNIIFVVGLQHYVFYEKIFQNYIIKN